ncbi:hypothetical protein [Uliginosibacterium sediminicola]|uniref:Aspartyl protease n=1 Tax=Uliginosibacterium sediminicola TaxID=2024550 RepID=A0ABU9Z0L9_9RHOO
MKTIRVYLAITTLAFNAITACVAAECQELAVIIPFSSSNKKMMLQFDTGAPRNIIYEDALSDDFKSKALRSVSQDREVKSMDVQFEGVSSNTTVSFFPKKNFNPNDKETDEIPLVGTLGLEFLGDTGFAIDYPRQRIYILSAAALDQFESRYSKHFHPYWTKYGKLENKIVFPFEIENKKGAAVFDTGSSMFEISVPRAVWKDMSHVPLEQADKKLTGQSWGESLVIYGKSVRFDIKLGPQIFPLSEIYASSSKNQDWLNVIGNKLFFNSVIVFDVRKKIYLVL